MTDARQVLDRGQMRVMPVALVSFIIALVVFYMVVTGDLSGADIPTQADPIPLIPFVFAGIAAIIIVVLSWVANRLPAWKVAVTTGDVSDGWEEVEDE